jgi:hypothetical protein
MEEPVDKLNPDESPGKPNGTNNPPPNVPSIWDEPKILLVSQSKVISATRAGNNLALIFNDLNIALNAADQPLTGATAATFHAPLTPDEDKPFLGYFISIQGGLDKDVNARATLLVDVAGVTKTLEFPYNQKVGVSGEDGELLQELFGVERRGSKNQYPNGQRPPLPPVAVTIVLTGQRLSTNDSLLISIDSMSIEAMSC